MTSSAPFVLPKARALADGVTALPGAKLYFFTAGTSNALTVYQDSAGTTPHAIPVVADSAGRFAPIYTPNGTAYKYELRDSAGTLIEQADNVPGPVDLTTVTVEFAKWKLPILSKSASYTVQSTEVGKLHLVDTTAGSVTVTLPSAVLYADKTIVFEKTASTGTISIQAASGDVIYAPTSSGTSYQMKYQGEWAVLAPAAGSWRVITSRPVTGSITADLLSSSISGSFMRAGMVTVWPVDGTLPSGYLDADGSAISRTTYAELFAIYGTKYGAGDGSTTFNVPDYRGEFLRGWANGSSNDPDRASRTNRGDGTTGDVVGTKQASELKTHTHTATASTTVTVTPSAASNFLADGGSTQAGSGTAIDLPLPVTANTSAATTVTVNNYSGTTETRPRNVAVRWVIFAGQSIAAGASSAISTLLHGTGAPTDILGANGDFYIDLASGKMWGPKASGTWSGTSFRLAITQGRPWKWSTSTTDADPGAGYLRVNSGTMASVTQMFVSETDADGNPAATLLAGWLGLGSSTTRGIMTIEKVMAAGTYASFTVSGSLTDAGTYDKITLSHIGSAGTFAADDPVTVGFVPAGSAGATGATGPNVGLDYAWSTSTSGDPGSGKLLVNNATPASATQINISETNRRGGSQATFIASWDDSTTTSARGTVRIMDVADPGANYLEYLITGAMTDAGAYDTFPVSYQGGAGTIANNTIVSVMFTRTGDKGADGAGTGDVSGPASSVDSEIALFSSTTGKVIKRASTTGMIKAASGVIAAATAGTDFVKPDTATAYTAHQGVTLATLTDGASISWTVSSGQKAKVTLGGNRTMNAVTGAVEGYTYLLWVIQDATGSRTLSWTTSGAGSFDFGALGAPTLTTTASKADLLTFEAISIGGTLKLRYAGIQKGFA